MFNLNRSSFKSGIGILYYSWIHNNTDLPVIVYIGNSEKSYEDYQQKLCLKFSEVIFSDRSSVFFEEKIKNYFNKNKESLNMPYRFLTGSDFEKNIWRKTAEVPYGQVSTYKEVAENAGYPGAWRAAGTALGNNPVMLVIPCHRIIKSSGQIGKYGGGEKVKAFLLEHESG
jgi:O-6-methylguanine DNA methyltransferase